MLGRHQRRALHGRARIGNRMNRNTGALRQRLKRLLKMRLILHQIAAENERFWPEEPHNIARRRGKGRLQRMQRRQSFIALRRAGRHIGVQAAALAAGA